MSKYSLFFFIILFLFSCTKEIDINLNEANSKYVIEGNLSTAAGTSQISIHKTINFSETAPYPAATGALVVITDNTAVHSDTLSEISAGLYSKTNLVGIEGHSYTLSVSIDNQLFTSTSTMPFQVLMDTIYQEDPLAGIPAGNRPSIRFLTPHYTDPANQANSYQFLVTRNDTLSDRLFIINDFAVNGLVNEQPLRMQAEPNDVVKVEMQCIDKAVYDYLFGLDANLGQSSASPANPTSNISGGALGYFKVHTSQIKTIVIQ